MREGDEKRVSTERNKTPKRDAIQRGKDDAFVFWHKPWKFRTRRDLRGPWIRLLWLDIGVYYTASEGIVGQPVEISNEQWKTGAGLNERSRKQTQIWESVNTEVISEARSTYKLKGLRGRGSWKREKNAGLQAGIWVQEREQEGEVHWSCLEKKPSAGLGGEPG